MHSMALPSFAYPKPKLSVSRKSELCFLRRSSKYRHTRRRQNITAAQGAMIAAMLVPLLCVEDPLLDVDEDEEVASEEGASEDG